MLVLSDGKLIADGLPKDVFNQKELLLRAKLRQPFLLEAKEAFAAEGICVPDEVKSIEELGDYLW